MENEQGEGEAQREGQGHIVEYATLAKVWIALLALTALLVVAGKRFHQTLSVPALLTITPLKAGLVFYYFMHLKYEGILLKTMLVVTLAALVIFIGLMFFDLSFR